MGRVTERERNREILQEMHPDLLAFMDDMREQFEGVRVDKLFCEVETCDTATSNE